MTGDCDAETKTLVLRGMSASRYWSKVVDPAETGISLGMFSGQRGRPRGTIDWLCNSALGRATRMILKKWKRCSCHNFGFSISHLDPGSRYSVPPKIQITSKRLCGAGYISEKSPSHRIHSSTVRIEEFFVRLRLTDRETFGDIGLLRGRSQ